MARTSVKHRFFFLLVVFCLPALLHAQEPAQLEPGQSVEREIAGGQTHTYQITLTAGQWMRVVVEQNGINVSLLLTGPDKKVLSEVDDTAVRGLESISWEAAIDGHYQLTVRALAPTNPFALHQLPPAIKNGNYELRLESRTTATATDRQRLAAEKLFAEAHKIVTQRPDPSLSLAQRRQQMQQLNQQAFEKLQPAITLWQQINDRYWEAVTLIKLGNYSAQDKPKAIALYEQALTIWRELADHYREAETLSTIGLAWFNITRLDINPSARFELAGKAIPYYEQSLSLSRELKDRAGEANALMRCGESYAYSAQREKQYAYFEQALTIYRAIPDRTGEVLALNRLGVFYYTNGRLDKATAYYEQAIAVLRENKHLNGEANLLPFLAVAWLQLGRFEKAIECHERAIQIAREQNNRPLEAREISILGGFYSVMGNFEKALELSEKSLVIRRELNELSLGSELMNLGVVNSLLQHYEKALEYFEAALTNIREHRQGSSETSALVRIGDTHGKLGNREKELQYYEQALARAREIDDTRQEVYVLNTLSRFYLKGNQPEKALELNSSALAIVRRRKDNEYSTLDLQSEIYLALGRFAEAIDYKEQKLRDARERKSKMMEDTILSSLMTIWKTRNQPRLAILYGKQAINISQEIRNNLRGLDAEAQQSYLKSKEQAYRELADLLIAQGRLPEAEQIIRMLKEEEYFEYIRRDENNAPKAEKATLTPEEAELDKRYREIADKLSEIGTERSALLEKKSRTPAEEQRLAKLEGDLVVAGQAFQKFLDSLATELGKHKDTNARMFQLRESQGLMEDLRELGKGVVALYTLVGEDKYRVILTTADFQKGYEYPIKAADLNRKVLAFRDALQNPKLDPLPLAQELYKILVAPVAKDLQGTKAQMLMWSLDGVLRYVPVAALHDGNKYLVERYRTAVFTPASQSRLKDIPSKNWRAAGFGVTKAFGDKIPALPGVAEEMRGIIREAGSKTGVLPGSIKLDEQFTQEAMLMGLRERNPVVHVASHFQFQPGNETNSALLLGDGKFLSLAQIKVMSNVFSGVELLTLSACNTATGGSGANGKEVEGFGVLAQRQGAKAVVASLWPVADRSTKNLMQEFYKLREAKADVTKAEALRQAQIKLLRGELQVTGEALAAREILHAEDKTMNKLLFKVDPKAPYAHPYYWAPFILIGNWK